MILLIDNYDSFSYNLYQLIGEVLSKRGADDVAGDIRVVRNDELSVDEIATLHPDAIVLSPGPGRPENAGVCVDVVKNMRGKIPIFGVCLGHQAICTAYGATVTYAGELMHGKQKTMRKTDDSVLFRGLSKEFPAARYHSLAVDKATLPEDLCVTAVSVDGEVMAVEDIGRNVFGLQFHPESVMTPGGETILYNFLSVKGVTK